MAVVVVMMLVLLLRVRRRVLLVCCVAAAGGAMLVACAMLCVCVCMRMVRIGVFCQCVNVNVNVCVGVVVDVGAHTTINPSGCFHAPRIKCPLPCEDAHIHTHTLHVYVLCLEAWWRWLVEKWMSGKFILVCVCLAPVHPHMGEGKNKTDINEEGQTTTKPTIPSPPKNHPLTKMRLHHPFLL